MNGLKGTGAVVIGGDYQGLGIARSLGQRGIPVLVVDDERSIARASRFTTRYVRVKDLREEAATLDTLATLQAKFGLDGWVLYPTRDETVATLSRNREALTDTFRVPTPDWECIRYAWDKRQTYQLAEKLGLALPRTWFPREESDLEQIDTSNPVIIKPAVKEHFFYQTKAKAWRVDSKDGLRRLFRRAYGIVGQGEIIVQELIPGANTRQYSYCALFISGRPVAAMTVRRRRQHPSDFGRASTFCETVYAPELEKPATSFLRAIDYYGLVELEFMLDPRDGSYKLLDFNARTWGYHSLGAAAGVDFSYLLYRHQTGEDVPPVSARSGVRWIRLATDLPNALVDLRARRTRLRSYLRSFRGGIDTGAVWSWRDPLPGLYELALLPYLFVKRGL